MCFSPIDYDYIQKEILQTKLNSVHISFNYSNYS